MMVVSRVPSQVYIRSQECPAPDSSAKVVLGGHLVLDGDRDAVALLHQLLDHAVDQLHLGKFAMVEDQTVGALGEEGHHAQGSRGNAGSGGGGRAMRRLLRERWPVRLFR